MSAYEVVWRKILVFSRSNKCVCQQTTVSSRAKEVIFRLTQHLFKNRFLFVCFFLSFFFGGEKNRAAPPSKFQLQEMYCAWRTLKILHMFHAAQSLMFDMMTTLPFQGHTSCIRLREKQSDQIMLLHANPTTLRQGWLLPAQPLNFHPKQMCVFGFFLIA